MESKTTAALRAEVEQRLTRQQEAHAKIMQDTKAQLSIERESWEEMFTRKQESVLKAKVGEVG